MGYRICSAKIYKVEYGEVSRLNYDSEAFEHMVMDTCNGDFYSDGNDYNVAKHYEIDRSVFLDMIENVKNANEEEFKDWGFEEDVTKEYVVETLQLLYDEADKDNDFVRLAWM